MIVDLGLHHCLLMLAVLSGVQSSPFKDRPVRKAESTSREELRSFLDYVEQAQANAENCAEGTAEIMNVEFSKEEWNSYAEVAVQTANMVSKLLRNSEEPGKTLALGTLYDLLRNNVQNEDIIFGSGLPFADSVIPGQSLYCPYAFKEEGVVKVTDILYDYKTNKTEYYEVLASKQDWSQVTKVTYSFDATIYSSVHPELATRVIQDPVARLEDGHWTKPYFDCGGGNVWMITYAAPILGMRNNSVYFRGVATIDIQLTDIDINQCDPDDETGSGFSDQFRGTHQCPATTQCVHQPGSGFVSGSYLCVCPDGYYFSDQSSSIKAFQGSVLEADPEAADQAACLKCPFKFWACGGAGSQISLPILHNIGSDWLDE